MIIPSVLIIKRFGHNANKRLADVISQEVAEVED